MKITQHAELDTINQKLWSATVFPILICCPRKIIYIYYKIFDIHRCSSRLAHLTHSASIFWNRKTQRSLIRGCGTSIILMMIPIRKASTQCEPMRRDKIYKLSGKSDLSEIERISTKTSEYDQEMPQSQTIDQPSAPWGRHTEHRHPDKQQNYN